eukprot:TRINITY_DN13322_c1_g1_i1.p1 TRINITY_DN13322_c1_g1~~TRINITY_DN13322_c1_g1_i1.p1  ORF type:complete len:253 (+),score=32.98 TRINITY_DN13322_c1_g1_i1:37-795(+)
MFNFFRGKEPGIEFSDENGPPVQVVHGDVAGRVRVEAELTRDGISHEMRFGAITDEEYAKTFYNRTPEEIKWEEEAAWRLYPKLAAGALGGAIGGFLLFKGHTVALNRIRGRLVREQGKKVLEEPDVKLNSWISDPSKVKRAKYLYIFGGSFITFCNTFSYYYPSYLEDVASMPNSNMALAVKRMHRQLYLRDNVKVTAVSEDDVNAAKSRYESRKSGESPSQSEARPSIPGELAGGAGLGSTLGGGYKAQG